MNPAIVATVILLLCSPSSARIAKPSPRSKPRIQHNGAQPMFKAGQHEIGPDGLVQYGLVRIPANDSNAHGCSTSHICKLEYEGKFEEAFAEYERIMMKCGDGPWTTFAALGRGETAAVVLRKSPCGSFVAMKMPAILSAAKHNAADCAILRRLSPSLHNPTCQGCFPRHFYYSNITGVCYNEYIPSIPMSRFMKAYRDVDLSPDSDENLAVVKEAFRQSLHAVAILRDNGIIHKDLLFKNMLVRLRPGENPWFRVVIMDFCWSESKHDPEAYKTFTLLPLGHFTRPGDW
jgi:serine/threonine protein kinase